ncbi:hypothetical protein TrRE_jg7433 [Triparma retinervis]|uniref:SET domain-containing protein n=1 Tax=Triparma retinervis TaxID=2557542 RepID=A0A9W6ZCJ4_9STRA|nr:hypothetical protein TrRE_jg7433 [Triparma retinervis]
MSASSIYATDAGFEIHPSLAVLSASGFRGVYAKDDIDEETLLAKIPLTTTLSKTQLLSHPLFSSLSSFLSPTGPSSLSTDDILAVAIHVCRTTTLLDTVLFNPFAKLFPRIYKSPIFLAPGSLSYDALRHTSLLRTTQVLQGQIQQDHERLNSLLKQYNALHEEPHFPVDEDFPLECYVHSLFSVYSRGADVSFGGNGEESIVNRERMIVPFLDMFNHSSSSTVHYKYSSDSSSIHILSGSSPIKSGTEVNLNYGAVPNSKLLLFYGFSLQDNEEDFVDIYVPLQEGVDGREEKVKLLQASFPDFIPNAPFTLKSGGCLPPSLL